MKRLTDPSFRYTPSCATNIKATFARVRREMKEAKAQVAEHPKAPVLPIKKAKP